MSLTILRHTWDWLHVHPLASRSVGLFIITNNLGFWRWSLMYTIHVNGYHTWFMSIKKYIKFYDFFMAWPKYSCRHTFWWCQMELLPIFPVKTEVHSRTESTENFLQKLEMLKAINEKLYSTQSRKDVDCFFCHLLYLLLLWSCCQITHSLHIMTLFVDFEKEKPTKGKISALT